MSNPELYKLLAEEAAKVAVMTPEERSVYYDQIKAGQLAYMKANPYTEGDRQARAMRPKPTLADALELPEIKALVEALNEIGSISPRKKNCYPEDWREQIKACPECQRYADHPVQRGICDDHRMPVYAQSLHDRHEEKILGYRASQIARDALAALQTEEGV